MEVKVMVEFSPAAAKLITDFVGALHGTRVVQAGAAPAPKPVKAAPAPAAAPAAADGEPKRGRGRPPKAAAAPKAVEDQEDESEEAEDEEVDDAEEEDFEEVEETDEVEKVTGDDLKKLKAALRAYSDKNGKEAAVKLLLKYGKTSADVTVEKLPELLKKLKVAKAA